MHGADVFSTIAEVAVAFLGFTGVVGVFSGQDHPPAVSLRLWVMVECGLALLLLALLPLVLHHLGLAAPGLWVACSVATLLFLLGHTWLVAPRIVGYVRSGAWGEVPAVLSFSVPVALFGCFLTQLANSLGVALERSQGGFLLGLFLLLAASGLNFAGLLVALRSVESGEVSH